MAWTVPRRTVISMSLLATTPGKRLVMPCSSTAGAVLPLGALGRSFTVESVMTSSSVPARLGYGSRGVGANL